VITPDQRISDLGQPSRNRTKTGHKPGQGGNALVFKGYGAAGYQYDDSLMMDERCCPTRAGM